MIFNLKHIKSKQLTKDKKEILFDDLNISGIKFRYIYIYLFSLEINDFPLREFCNVRDK